MAHDQASKDAQIERDKQTTAFQIFCTIAFGLLAPFVGVIFADRAPAGLQEVVIVTTCIAVVIVVFVVKGLNIISSLQMKLFFLCMILSGLVWALS